MAMLRKSIDFTLSIFSKIFEILGATLQASDTEALYIASNSAITSPYLLIFTYIS